MLAGVAGKAHFAVRYCHRRLQGAQVSADLQPSYIPAAQHFPSREDLYLILVVGLCRLMFNHNSTASRKILRRWGSRSLQAYPHR